MLGRAVAPAPKAQQTLGVVGLTSTSEEPHGLIIAGRPAAGPPSVICRHRRPVHQSTLVVPYPSASVAASS